MNYYIDEMKHCTLCKPYVINPSFIRTFVYHCQLKYKLCDMNDFYLLNILNVYSVDHESILANPLL